MRRPRRSSMSGMFYNTGDLSERTVDESLGFTREFTDRTNQEMLTEERLEKKHELERKQQQGNPYPSCDLNDKPQPGI